MVLSDRWRREVAAGCGFASLWFAIRAATTVGVAGWLGAVVAAGLLLAAVRLAG